jgi:hypothetical protein
MTNSKSAIKRVAKEPPAKVGHALDRMTGQLVPATQIQTLTEADFSSMLL